MSNRTGRQTRSRACLKRLLNPATTIPHREHPIWLLNPHTTDPDAAYPWFASPFAQRWKRTLKRARLQLASAPAGRWEHTNTMIPAQQGVMGNDRYAYSNNNPVNYTDPSGHWACGDYYDSGCAETADEYRQWWAETQNLSEDEARQDYLYSLIFQGSDDGEWTRDDWDYYYSHRNKLWNDPTSWINPDPETGWDLFALHVERLASHYSSTMKGQFVEDFALVFGGLSREETWPIAAWEAAQGPTLPYLNYGNEGLAPDFIDSLNPPSNQSHHYGGIFFLSYHVELEISFVLNYIRDTDNWGDIWLGNQGATDAYYFRYYGVPVADMIRQLALGYWK